MKTKFIPFVVLLATLTLFVGQNSVLADRVVFQPGSSVGKDMWFSSVYNTTAVDDNKLQVGGWGDQYRTLLRFDLTGLPQTATSAYMYLYTYPRGDSSTPVSMNVYVLTVDWNEQTQYYYTPLYGYFGGTHPAPTVNSWYGINITGIYNAWKDGTYTNYGFAFLPTATDNRFNMFRSSDYSDYRYRPKLVVDYDGANFGFPLPNYTPYNVPISAVVDHSMTTGGGCADGVVVAYTGETGESEYGVSNWSHDNESDSCPNDILRGFKNSSGTQFNINNQYVTSSGNEYGYYLFYDGHTGYDYPATNGTEVRAAASGTAYYYDTGDVKIVHPSGYDTYYLHLSTRSIYNGQLVTKGDPIGTTGSGHLHFTVKKGLQRVDPYGWKGEYGADPLEIITRIKNVCLWDSCQ